MTQHNLDPTMSAITYGQTARTASPLPVPYIINGERLALKAADLLDTLCEQSGIEEKNIYIALGNVAAQQTTEIVFASGLCTMNLHKRTLSVMGHEVDLTPMSYATLSIYARNLDKVIPRDYVEELLWPNHNTDNPPKRSTLNNHVKNIRDILNTYVPGLGDSKSGVFRSVERTGRILCSEYLDGLAPIRDYETSTTVRHIRTTTNPAIENQSIQERPMSDKQIAIGGGKVVYDAVSRELIGSNETIRLSGGQAEFLKLLTANIDRFISNEEIAKLIWGAEVTPENKKFIRRFNDEVKKKLSALDAELGHVETGPLLAVSGRGYILLSQNKS